MKQMVNFNELILLDEYLFLNVMVRNLELFKAFISMSIGKELTKIEVNADLLSQGVVAINAFGEEEYDIYFKIVSTDDITEIRKYYEKLMFEKYIQARIHHHPANKAYLLLLSIDDPFFDNQCKHTLIYECQESPSVAEAFPETIILCPYGEKGDIGGNIREFMDYLAGKSVRNEYIEAVEKEVKKVKQNVLLEEEYYSTYVIKKTIYDKGYKTAQIMCTDATISILKQFGLTEEEMEQELEKYTCYYPMRKRIYKKTSQ